jgi:hypothetical protein
VRERVERTDDVGAVDPEIKCEVIPSSRRNTYVRNIVVGGKCGDNRLRTVTTRDADRVGTPCNRGERYFAEVVAGVEDDRFDTARVTLVGEVDALGFSATGARVDDN